MTYTMSSGMLNPSIPYHTCNAESEGSRGPLPRGEKRKCSTNKLCAWRHNMPPPLQVDSIFAFTHQVAVLFWHNNIFVFIRQVAPVPACWLFKTSATSWPLTFWPWKWCPSHMWRGLLLCQF